MLVHFFAYPPPPTLTLTMRTRCQPPNAATPRPSTLSRDVGLCQPSHRQRKESEGRESRGGPRKWEARSVRHENRGTTKVVPRFRLFLSPPPTADHSSFQCRLGER